MYRLFNILMGGLLAAGIGFAAYADELPPPKDIHTNFLLSCDSVESVLDQVVADKLLEDRCTFNEFPFPVPIRLEPLAIMDIEGAPPHPKYGITFLIVEIVHPMTGENVYSFGRWHEDMMPDNKKDPA